MSLMPPVRSSASKCRAHVVAVILSLGEIMPTYSRCVLKGLVYIVIVAPLGRQPFFYTKCIKLNIRSFCNIKLNMRSFCDIKLVFNTKCIYLIRF